MPGGSICSSLSYISVRDGGSGRGEASTRSIKLSGSQRSCTGRLSAAPRASSSQHPISLPPRLISPTPRLKFPMPSVCLCSSAAPGPGPCQNTGRCGGLYTACVCARAFTSEGELATHSQQRQGEAGGPYERQGAKKKKKHKSVGLFSLLPMSPFFFLDYIHDTVVYSLSLRVSGSFLLSLGAE